VKNEEKFAKMFTNWLTSDISKTQTMSAASSVNNNPSPDIIIEVGPTPFTRFPAHSNVLSSQSGYFRASIYRLSENGGKSGENVIYLPNINVDHFTPLLTYMYTGYLDLNFENIFGVLLATHLLHMPRALEICRDFLAHTQRHNDYFHSPPLPSLTHQSASASTSKVIRPIASKASNFGLNFVSPPKATTNLLPSIGTKFKSFSVDHEIRKIEEQKIDEKKVEEEKIVKKSVKISSSPASVTSSKNLSLVEGSNDKVVIDIASCDGPVRFKRVLNDAFEKKKVSSAPPEIRAPTEMKFHSTISFHEQMVRNINEQYKKTFQSGEESENSQHSIEIYTCVYCNHTFKSKYCYQKHAKRHINPLNPLGRCRIDADYESSDGESKKQSTTKRDSIKPLDMNVQYYPCKYCGCKFPSYYFVHKHRKLCHPEVDAGEGNSGSGVSQIEGEKNKEEIPKDEENP
jgi:hypothetical protein